MDEQLTCVECNTPRSLCQNCDNPKCRYVVCNAHVNKFNKQYLCYFCYHDKFVAQQPRFVSVMQFVVLNPLTRKVVNQ